MVFSEILKKYGDLAVLSLNGNEVEAKVFIQPVIHNRLERDWHKMTGLGNEDISRFYYFGPAEVAIEDVENSYITCAGKTFDFLKAEPFRAEREVSHWEGLLRVRGEVFDGGA